MICRRLGWIGGVLCVLGGVLTAQPKSPALEQSPRKALLEMFYGGEDAIKKHLTLEVQARISEMLKASALGSMDPVQAVNMAKAAGGENLESFEAGPVLFSYNNAPQHQRFEVRIDGDDRRGTEDEMRLSLRSFRDGVEEDLPATLRLTLSWKLQQSIWRLNVVTLSATVPIGDPRFLDKSGSTPPAMGHAVRATAATPPAASAPASPPAPVSPAHAAANERSKMTPARAVRLIGLAEDIYAQKHPETGFTCFLSELVDVSKGMDDGETYRFMDPEFAGGVYNGYRFSLSGCAGKPARVFQVTAEPLAGTGRAYCSDATRELHGSDDGNGVSCLASGKIVQR